jgi:RimJ/RimL family protein N-acetyltransferase
MRLETSRLLLRPWEDRDRTAFAAINADTEVRRYYFPSILSRAQSDELIDRCAEHLDRYGFGFVAVERRDDGCLIGGLGLSRPGPEVPGAADMEIGWILGRANWRRGYAIEAASACLVHAWSAMGANEVIAYTSTINAPSRRLMEKLGMTRSPADDFDDSTVPEGNALRPHVLYRIGNPAIR